MQTRIRFAVVIAVSLAGAGQVAAQQPPALTATAPIRQPRPLTTSATQQLEAAQTPKFASPVRVPMESKIVTGAPYSAEVVIESVQVLGDGNRIVNKTTGRVYRDSAGRIRREEDSEPGRLASVSITDPVERMSLSLDPDSKTAWKTPAAAARVLAGKIATASADPAELDRQRKLNEELQAQNAPGALKRTTAPVAHPGGPRAAAGRAATAWGEKVDRLPAREIEGVMAEGTRITRTIPAGAIGNDQPIVSITEEWVSPELQILLMTRTSDPRSGEHTYRLLNIVRAEPNQSWFVVPPDYTVRETGVRAIAPAKKR